MSALAIRVHKMHLLHVSVRGTAAGTDGVKVTAGVGGTDDETLTPQPQPSALTSPPSVSRPDAEAAKREGGSL